MQTSNNQTLSGRYTLGEMRDVRGDVEFFDAHDQLLDRPVTVQILTADGASRPERARAFLRHQQIASGVHNCPVMAVYDAGTWEGRPYSVMERDKGDPPQSLYRPGYPADISTAVSVARQVAEALACCREAGLSDWTFSPVAVRIDKEGNGCLAVLEGLDGPF